MPQSGSFAVKKMANLTNRQKKDWAKTIYLNEHLLQKEIADRVGTTQQTLCKWIAKERWEALKTSLSITREEQLGNMYRQIAEVNASIAAREEGKRFATSKEADIINKLATAIDKMERETGLADIIGVSKSLLSWVRRYDATKAKELSYIFDDYIKEKLK
jgi:transcriptional regulator with XRE-family HTH domain